MKHKRHVKENVLRRTRWMLVAIALSLAVAACGDSGPLTVTEAQSASGNQSVVGLLVADGDVVRLCEVLLESFPPQCGGASIEVRGLDLATVNGLQSERGVSWTDRQIALTGVLESGVLDVES
ncbi:MAG: hypothetical protein GXP34_12620 [Actinobacteria bacterium]|nr:hypothetical protein [Actinomycetota bacterium]